MESGNDKLIEVRKKIDLVDEQMKKLFLERMELADCVAVIKAESGEAIYNPDREKAMLERLAANVEPKFQEPYIRFLKEILSISKDYQKKRMLA